MEGVEGSLKRLQTDYIDLYQFHRPDPNTPIEETLRAFDDLVRDGKVLYIGNSNFAAWQIADASWAAAREHLTQFVSAQPEYSMLVRAIETEIIPACDRFGLGILPYFPLAMGFLTGKHKRGADIPEGTRMAMMPAARRSRGSTTATSALSRSWSRGLKSTDTRCWSWRSPGNLPHQPSPR